MDTNATLKVQWHPQAFKSGIGAASSQANQTEVRPPLHFRYTGPGMTAGSPLLAVPFGSPGYIVKKVDCLLPSPHLPSVVLRAHSLRVRSGTDRVAGLLTAGQEI